MAQATAANPKPRIRDLVGYFLRLGTFGFDGPVAWCGLMEQELVQERGLAHQTRDERCHRRLAIAAWTARFAAYLRGGFWGAWAGAGPLFYLIS
jgi:chromate transporter